MPDKPERPLDKEQLLNRFKSMARAVRLALPNVPDKPPGTKSLMVVDEWVSRRRDGRRFESLSLVTLFDGFNHGIQIELWPSNVVRVRAWNQGPNSQMSKYEVELRKNLDIYVLNDALWAVGIPHKEID